MNLLISAIISVPVAFIFFYLRQYYLRTSRELKRLDSLLKSPIYNHVSTTFIGRSSIKSFSLGDVHHFPEFIINSISEKMICDQFNDLQDNYGAAYLLLCQTSRYVPIDKRFDKKVLLLKVL